MVCAYVSVLANPAVVTIPVNLTTQCDTLVAGIAQIMNEAFADLGANLLVPFGSGASACYPELVKVCGTLFATPDSAFPMDAIAANLYGLIAPGTCPAYLRGYTIEGTIGAPSDATTSGELGETVSADNSPCAFGYDNSACAPPSTNPFPFCE